MLNQSADKFCSWQPDEFGPNLKRLTEYQTTYKNSFYNEIIIDSHHLDSTLPGGIEAIFYVKGSRSAKAVDAHANFLAAYAKRGVTKDTFPLVQLDPMNWDNPFEVDAG